MDFYNLETAELVRKRYAKDIEVFGYQNTYDELIDYLKYKETA